MKSTIKFDPVAHENLTLSLSRVDYPMKYINFCLEFGGHTLPIAKARPDVVCDILNNLGVKSHYDQQWNIVSFDSEKIDAWCFVGKIVFQRYGSIELLFDGYSGNFGIGNTWLNLAIESAKSRSPEIPYEQFFPPNLPQNRPSLNVDGSRLTAMLTDMVQLFRIMKCALP